MAVNLFQEESGSIIRTVIDIRIGVGSAGTRSPVIDDHAMSRLQIVFVHDPVLRDVVRVILGKAIHDRLGDDVVLSAGEQPDLRMSQMGRVIDLARGRKSIGSRDKVGDLRDGIGGIGVHAVMCRPPYIPAGAVIGSTRDDTDTAHQA